MDKDLHSLQTPALVLDEARLDANCDGFIARARGLGVSLRPHVKTAKSVEVARRACGGAAGPITVSTLREAEHFAAAGFSDILWAQAITPDKFGRLFALPETITVVTDEPAVARALARAAADAGRRQSVLIEIDCGEHRSGLLPDDPRLLEVGRALAGDLAVRSPARLRAGARRGPDEAAGAAETPGADKRQETAAAAGTRLAGVMTHAGHSYAQSTHEGMRRIAQAERQAVLAAAGRLRGAGLPCPIISVGSTPTFRYGDDFTGITEVRAGVYVFYDLSQAMRHVCDRDEIALTVLSTVIGHNRQAGRLLLDAGGLALSKDLGANADGHPGYGELTDLAGHRLGLAITTVYQEHGVVEVADETVFERHPVGSRVRILPNHACMTAAGGYDGYHVLRGGGIGAIWPRFNGW
ncbi:MAG: alanine racemase [Burkholderiaceae bacterium]